MLPQQRFIEAAARWARRAGVKYTVNAGDPACASASRAHYGYPHMSDARNVCVTTGSQEAVYVAIKTMLDPGADELLVVDPAFPAYAKIAQLEGIAARRVHMRAEDDFRYDVDAILEARRPRDADDRDRLAREPDRARAARRGRAPAGAKACSRAADRRCGCCRTRSIAS